MSDTKQSSETERSLPGAELFNPIAKFWSVQPNIFWDAGRAALAKGNGKLVEDATTMTTRIFEFGQGRIAEDLDCLSELSRCTSPGDIVRLQQAWIKTAVTDYQKGGVEIYRAGMQLLSDSLEVSGNMADSLAERS